MRDLVESFDLADSMVFIRDHQGRTALHFAATSSNSFVLPFLTKLVNAYDLNGHVPLHIAAWFGHAEFACDLIKAGADAFMPTAATIDGRPEDTGLTAVDIACKHQWWNTARAICDLIKAKYPKEIPALAPTFLPAIRLVHCIPPKSLPTPITPSSDLNSASTVGTPSSNHNTSDMRSTEEHATTTQSRRYQSPSYTPRKVEKQPNKWKRSKAGFYSDEYESGGTSDGWSDSSYTSVASAARSQASSTDTWVAPGHYGSHQNGHTWNGSWNTSQYQSSANFPRISQYPVRPSMIPSAWDYSRTTYALSTTTEESAVERKISTPQWQPPNYLWRICSEEEYMIMMRKRFWEFQAALSDTWTGADEYWSSLIREADSPVRKNRNNRILWSLISQGIRGIKPGYAQNRRKWKSKLRPTSPLIFQTADASSTSGPYSKSIEEIENLVKNCEPAARLQQLDAFIRNDYFHSYDTQAAIFRYMGYIVEKLGPISVGRWKQVRRNVNTALQVQRERVLLYTEGRSLKDANNVLNKISLWPMEWALFLQFYYRLYKALIVQGGDNKRLRKLIERIDDDMRDLATLNPLYPAGYDSSKEHSLHWGTRWNGPELSSLYKLNQEEVLCTMYGIRVSMSSLFRPSLAPSDFQDFKYNAVLMSLPFGDDLELPNEMNWTLKHAWTSKITKVEGEPKMQIETYTELMGNINGQPRLSTARKLEWPAPADDSSKPWGTQTASLQPTHHAATLDDQNHDTNDDPAATRTGITPAAQNEPEQRSQWSKAAVLEVHEAMRTYASRQTAGMFQSRGGTEGDCASTIFSASRTPKFIRSETSCDYYSRGGTEGDCSRRLSEQDHGYAEIGTVSGGGQPSHFENISFVSQVPGGVDIVRNAMQDANFSVSVPRTRCGQVDLPSWMDYQGDLKAATGEARAQPTAKLHNEPTLPDMTSMNHRGLARTMPVFADTVLEQENYHDPEPSCETSSDDSCSNSSLRASDESSHTQRSEESSTSSTSVDESSSAHSQQYSFQDYLSDQESDHGSAVDDAIYSEDHSMDMEDRDVPIRSIMTGASRINRIQADLNVAYAGLGLDINRIVKIWEAAENKEEEIAKANALITRRFQTIYSIRLSLERYSEEFCTWGNGQLVNEEEVELITDVVGTFEGTHLPALMEQAGREKIQLETRRGRPRLIRYYGRTSIRLPDFLASVARDGVLTEEMRRVQFATSLVSHLAQLIRKEQADLMYRIHQTTDLISDPAINEAIVRMVTERKKILAVNDVLLVSCMAEHALLIPNDQYARAIEPARGTKRMKLSTGQIAFNLILQARTHVEIWGQAVQQLLSEGDIAVYINLGRQHRQCIACGTEQLYFNEDIFDHERMHEWTLLDHGYEPLKRLYLQLRPVCFQRASAQLFGRIDSSNPTGEHNMLSGQASIPLEQTGESNMPSGQVSNPLGQTRAESNHQCRHPQNPIARRDAAASPAPSLAEPQLPTPEEAAEMARHYSGYTITAQTILSNHLWAALYDLIDHTDLILSRWGRGGDTFNDLHEDSIIEQWNHIKYWRSATPVAPIYLLTDATTRLPFRVHYNSANYGHHQ